MDTNRYYYYYYYKGVCESRCECMCVCVNVCKIRRMRLSPQFVTPATEVDQRDVGEPRALGYA